MAPAAPVRPVGPLGPATPVDPWGPCGPVWPGVPTTVEGTHLVPLNTSAWPAVGALVVRSSGVPCSFMIRIWFCVPARSPLKLPVTSHALRAWNAGTMVASGVSACPDSTMCSFSPALPSIAPGSPGMGVAPSTTE